MGVTIFILILPMLRLLLPKAQGRKDICKPSNSFCYSLGSSCWVHSDEYPCARVSINFQFFCIIFNDHQQHKEVIWGWNINHNSLSNILSIYALFLCKIVKRIIDLEDKFTRKYLESYWSWNINHNPLSNIWSIYTLFLSDIVKTIKDLEDNLMMTS